MLALWVESGGSPVVRGSPALSVGCWFVCRQEVAGWWLVRAHSGLTSPPSPAVQRGAWQGIQWLEMPGSCAPAWSAFFQACLGPSPVRGYSTLQVRSAFFQPQGCGSCTQVGTSFPSLPSPFCWSISAVCYLDSSSVRQRLGATQAWFFLPTCHVPTPRWMDSLLGINKSRDWCGRFLSTQDWADPSPPQLVVVPCRPSSPSHPPVESRGWDEEGLWIPVPMGSCP